MAHTILHVDDDPALPQGFEVELERLGYRLVHTEDPDEALALVREGRPDLLLIEPLLASGDGFGLLEEMRSVAGEDLPVVVLTRGERSPELYGRALDLGAREFLCKPVLRPQLLESVLEYAAREQDSRAPDPEADADGTGDLAECPAAEVLQQMHRRGATGVVLFRAEGGRAAAELRNGFLVAVGSSGPLESLESFLMRTGRITEEQREAALDQVVGGMGNLAEILVAMEVLTEEELDRALQRRAEEPLLAAFGWTSGTWSFAAGRTLDKPRVETERSLASLLIEGVTGHVPDAVVSARLRRRAPLYVSATEPGAPFRPDDAELPPDAAPVLEQAQGDRTLAELLDGAVVPERLLYALVVAGFAELHEDEVLPLLDEVPAEPGAGTDDAAAGGKSAAQRALEAETWFRKGNGLLKARRYDEALEAFGMASHLDPGEGEYVAHLGYALYLSNPDQKLVQREALEHLAKGVKLSPKRPRPFLFLGRIFKVKGDTDAAKKMFRRAYKLDPNGREALQELRVLEQRQRKGRGLMDLLKRR